MSELPQETADSAQPSTSEIIQTMQTLTDIEGDLADTAAAVASDSLRSEQSAQQTEQMPADNENSEALLLNAQQMEETLEQSIPDAPVATSSLEHNEQVTESAAPVQADSSGINASSTLR